MAVVLAVALIWFSYKVRLAQGASLAMKLVASLLIGLLAVQIALGAQIIWTHRSAATTTGHVVVGALTLAVTFSLTWIASRTKLEQRFSHV